MRLVPAYRGSPPKLARDQMQRAPTGAFCPCPSLLNRTVVPPDRAWHDVDGQSVLMRRLPWPRFASASGEDVYLPLWAAEALEEFEAKLRLSGLISPGQVLQEELGANPRLVVKECCVSVGGQWSLLDVDTGELLPLQSPSEASDRSASEDQGHSKYGLAKGRL